VLGGYAPSEDSVHVIDLDDPESLPVAEEAPEQSEPPLAAEEAPSSVNKELAAPGCPEPSCDRGTLTSQHETEHLCPRRLFHQRPRRLFHQTPHLHVVNQVRHEDLPAHLREVTNADLQYATRISSSATRQMCDCVTCVTHAIEWTNLEFATERPPAPGIRIVRLEGLHLTPASVIDQTMLRRAMERQPRQAMVVCGCISCSLHRNLTKAWLQARQLPPSAVSCHASDNKL